MVRPSPTARVIVVALIVGAAFAVCARDPVVDWRQELVVTHRGTIRDRAGRVVATGDGSSRVYPYAALGAHAVGHVGRTLGKDRVGRSGVEAAWDDVLHGRPGVLRIPIDAQGRDLEGATLTRSPIPGRDVTLTLDMDLMEIVERSFAVQTRGERYFPAGPAVGAVVVVDVHDGSVLALFSAPAFDPGAVSRVLSPEAIEELRASDALVDRSIGRSYRPGGTMKTLTLLAGLEAGIDPEASVDCSTDSYAELARAHGGHRHLGCAHRHGELDARRALVASCSFYAYSIADRVGFDPMAAVARDFGFGSVTGIGLEHEVSGRAPTPATFLGEPSLAAWQAAEMASGQGDLEVTPLQLAMAYAAIANGGTVWTPRIVSAVTAPDGTVIEDIGAHAAHEISASSERLAFLRDALDGVGRELWGRYPGNRGVRIAGKTGHGHDDSEGWYPEVTATWFAGFAPADDPEVAIVVLVEGNYYYLSARIANDILGEYLGEP